MSDSVVTPVSTVAKTYKYFDLTTFAEVKEKVEVTFNPPATLEEASARVGNDAKVILKALSAYLQRAAFGEKRKEIAGKGASKKIVLDIIRPLRNLPPWDVLERKAQTAALLEVVRNNSALVESIRAASLKAAEADEDEDGEETEES